MSAATHGTTSRAALDAGPAPARVLHETARAQIELVASIESIPAAAWHAIAPPDDPLWQYEFVKIIEASGLADRFFYILVRRQGRLVSVLPVFYFARWRLDDSLGPEWRSRIDAVRNKAFPKLLTIPALFCGSVLGAGAWLGRASLRPDEIGRVHAELMRVSGQWRVPWVFFKDFPRPELSAMCPPGVARYVTLPALPDAVLDLPFDTFDGYLAHLKVKARRNARAKIRKFHGCPGRRVERLTRFEHLLPEMQRLYEQVYEGATFRFDHLNFAFLRRLAADSSLDREVIGCWENDHLIAFSICLFQGKGAVNLRLGMDYTRIGDSMAYFIIHYESIKAALERGCTSVSFSITTYEPKRELGCRTVPYSHAGTHSSPLLRPLVLPLLPYAMTQFEAEAAAQMAIEIRD